MDRSMPNHRSKKGVFPAPNRAGLHAQGDTSLLSHDLAQALNTQRIPCAPTDSTVPQQYGNCCNLKKGKNYFSLDGI